MQAKAVAAALAVLMSDGNQLRTSIYKKNDNPENGFIEPFRNRVGPRIGRNDPCSCGSGKKSKKCCRQ